MNDKWKGFWRGVAAGAAVVLTALLSVAYALLRRPRGTGSSNGPVDDPQHVASETALAVEQARTEIKADTDDALAQRFNALAAKQKRKADE